MLNVSIIIPARNEPFLAKTVESIFHKAHSRVEIIVVLDGYWPDPILPNNDKLVLIHRSERMGMRNAINSAVSISRGNFLLKCDAHCLFGRGFDVQLTKDCGEDTVLVPRRYALNVKEWTRDKRKLFEFQYFDKVLKGHDWSEYSERVVDQMMPDLMTSQGSCWFMSRSWWDKIGGLDDQNYGGMGREAQEICLKTWLGGGRFVLDRNVWYAHWNKSKEHVLTVKSEKDKSVKYAVDFWMNDRWDKAIHPLSWLIERFKPVPGWM